MFEICILHKNKRLYLVSIPSCKMEKTVLFFNHKEEHPNKSRNKNKGASNDKAFQNSDHINLYEEAMNA